MFVLHPSHVHRRPQPGPDHLLKIRHPPVRSLGLNLNPTIREVPYETRDMSYAVSNFNNLRPAPNTLNGPRQHKTLRYELRHI